MAKEENEVLFVETLNDLTKKAKKHQSYQDRVKESNAIEKMLRDHFGLGNFLSSLHENS